MISRFEKLGIKQTIQKTWMDQVLHLLISGVPEKEIRKDLFALVSATEKQGDRLKRSENTCQMVISVLAAWFRPQQHLLDFRNRALDIARKTPCSDWLPLHWAVICASYPFWFNTAVQTGRLFKLQSKVTPKQIVDRLKEQYGDRESVARYARYTTRSFVAWGVLKDSASRGCYELCPQQTVDSQVIAALLLEAALITRPDGRSSLANLASSPGFFPFNLPVVTGDLITQKSPAISASRYNIDEEILQIK